MSGEVYCKYCGCRLYYNESTKMSVERAYRGAWVDSSDSRYCNDNYANYDDYEGQKHVPEDSKQ